MRRLMIAAFTVVLVTTVHGASTSLSVPVTEFTLANGLHVILHRDASVPVVSVNVWYHVGSANEKPGRTGFAHMF
jgi:zinc protease